LRLRVSPGAKRSGVNGPYGEGAVRLAVSAPPVDGKANAEVERFLAELAGLPRGSVRVVGGAASRDKTVLLEGMDAEAVRRVVLPGAGG